MSIYGFKDGKMSGNGYMSYVAKSGVVANQPITILNPKFETPGGFSDYLGIVGSINSGLTSTTIYNWNFYLGNSINNIYILNTKSTFGLSCYSLPSQYNYACVFQNYFASGTNYISQDVTFPQAGTYKLSFYAAGRITYYNTAQTLSAFIDTTQVITNWTATANGASTLVTSSPITVTAGTHTLKIQMNCSSSTVDTAISVTGFTITQQ